MSNQVPISQNTSHPSPRLNRIWMAVLLGALAAFAPLSIDMYLPALPMISEELGASPSVVQLSLTFCLLGLAFGQLLAGPLSDVRGRRTPILIGLVIYIFASVLCAFSHSIEGFIVLRFIQGVAGAAGIVISRAIVRDLYSGSEMTKFFSLLALVNGIAPIFAPIAGGQVLQLFPWQGVFIVLSLIGLIMLFAVFFGLRETLPAERRSESGINHTLTTFGKLMCDRDFMGYALSQGLVYAAMFAYISGSPFVMQNVFGTTPQMYSLIFGINGLGMIIASQTTGRLAGRVSEVKLFVIGIGISAIGSIVLLVMILAKAGLAAVLPPLFLVVSSVGIVNTTGSSLAMKKQARSAGSASAVLGVLSMTLGGTAAPFVGLGGSNNAVPMGIIIALASMGSVVSYFVLVRKRKLTHNVEKSFKATDI